MAESKSSRSRLTELIIKSARPKASRYDIRDEQNIGLVLRVAPTGRKTWSLSYRNHEGSQQRYTLGTWPNLKLARARQLATEKLGEVAGGHDVQAEKQQARQKKAVPTLKSFVAGEYGKWVKAQHKSSAATLRRLRHTLPWQNKPLDQITLKQAEHWQTARLNDGLAAETVKRDVATIRSLMSKAVEWGILESNPLAALRAPKGPENTVVRYISGCRRRKEATAGAESGICAQLPPAYRNPSHEHRVTAG